MSQAILTPLLNYFSIFLLIRVLKRRSITKAGDNQVTTQQEANNWFEGNPIELSSKYAHAVKIMWLVGFYSPLIPTLFIHGFVALVFTYWMDKVPRNIHRPSRLCARRQQPHSSPPAASRNTARMYSDELEVICNQLFKRVRVCATPLTL